MRVLLSTYGSRGDVEPMVALALALRDVGASVRMCAPPDFAPRLAEVGVPMVPVGWSARELTKSAPAASTIPQRAAELVAMQFAQLPAEDYDVVVATGMLPAAAGALSVAEKAGVPAVSVKFQKLELPSPHHTPMAYPGRSFPPDVTDNRELWALDAESVNALFGAALNTSREANGLPPVADVRSYVLGARPWLATDPTLDPVPDRWLGDLDVVQTGAWLTPDDRPLPPELEEFLAAGPPPIYVGFGSMPMHSATDLPRVVIESARAVGHRVVTLQGWADLDPTQGFVVGEVNQQALFTRVAAVVHHGGAGTTTTATRSGAPQVVLPQLADQPYWASRVAELGIGVAHDGPNPTTESLSAALAEALKEETRTRARAVAAHIRTDGTAVAAKLVLEAAGKPATA